MMTLSLCYWTCHFQMHCILTSTPEGWGYHLFRANWCQ